MTEPGQDAARWLPAARAGSGEALGAALEACRGYLLLIAQRELDPALVAKGGASDLVQETFLEAQRDLAQFHGTTEAELLAWLRRLLLNNLANFNRLYRATDKRQVGREVILEAGSSADARGTEPSADGTSPSGRAIAGEQAEAVRRAMERLPEDYRQVLVLRYQEELPFEEIGRRMARSSNAARQLLLRAAERLQQEMERPP